MADFLIKKGAQANYNALGTKDDNTVYVTTDTGNIYLGGKALFEASAFTKATLSGKKVTFTTHGANGTSGTSELDLATFATTDEVSSAISTHKTTVIDPLEARIQALEDLMGAEVTTLTTTAQTVKGAINEHDSEIGDVDSLSTTSKTLVPAINEVLAAVGTGGTAAVVTITELGAQGDYAQRYEVKQGKTLVGTINIPKEMVVEDGEVVVNPEGQPAGTYLKLTLQNVTNPIYIDVAKLIDVYTAQQSATQVQLSINVNKEISATIVAGSITATELATDAVTTAKIANNNVTSEKLSNAVRGSLENATTAYSKRIDEAAGDDYVTASISNNKLSVGISTGAKNIVDKAITTIFTLEGSGDFEDNSYLYGQHSDNDFIIDVKIKKLADAEQGVTGLADAYDVKSYVDTAVSDATIKWGTF